MEIRILIFDTDGVLQVSALADTPLITPRRICEWKRLYGRIAVKVIVDLKEINKGYQL